jgi:hypothetical protein
LDSYLQRHRKSTKQLISAFRFLWANRIPIVTNKNHPIHGINTTLDLFQKLKEMNSIFKKHYSKKRDIKAITKVFSRAKQKPSKPAEEGG